MSIIISELKKRLKELEAKHITRPIPSIVIETEFSRKPATIMYTSSEYKDLTEIFKGSSVKGEILGDEYIIYNLPQISFDSKTFKKIEDIAYGKFKVERIVDVPPIPHPRYGRETSAGLELIKDGKPIATIYSTRFHININFEAAEELADELIREVYRFEEKPSLLAILIWKIKKFLKKRFGGK
ncbi:MAG: hypothetical protein NDF57_05665 [archaeon GBS-70-058]|nr:hypothetical protein [Candidatus Culexarchaeum nevadense]